MGRFRHPMASRTKIHLGSSARMQCFGLTQNGVRTDTVLAERTALMAGAIPDRLLFESGILSSILGSLDQRPLCLGDSAIGYPEQYEADRNSDQQAEPAGRKTSRHR